MSKATLTAASQEIERLLRLLTLPRGSRRPGSGAFALLWVADQVVPLGGAVVPEQGVQCIASA